MIHNKIQKAITKYIANGQKDHLDVVRVVATALKLKMNYKRT